MTRAVLLPSPLLPALAYRPLAGALGRRGWDAVVADPPPAPTGPDTVLTAYRAAVARAVPDVVLAHSNAGRYAVAVAGQAPVVYLDAALPPERGEAPLAPEALLDHLSSLADADDRLPPWTRWWPEDAMAGVLPDREVLDRIREAETRLPTGYFRASLGAPARWQDHPQAYLAFGQTYAEELALARGLGWPTAVLGEAGHLHHLVDPDAVAAAVLDLAGPRPHGLRTAPGPRARTTG